MDRSELFMHPVSRIEVPDYYDTVKHPMHWKAIERKLAEHTYITVAEFLVSSAACECCDFELTKIRRRMTSHWYSTMRCCITLQTIPFTNLQLESRKLQCRYMLL